MRTGQRQRGYSITEMLTVVAIIGIVSLVLVPNFMSMYRSGKMKTATRNFISRVRKVQQQAVVENRRTRICLVPNAKTYTIWKEVTSPTTGVKSWQRQGEAISLEEAGAANRSGVISFSNTEFPDVDSDSINDIVFNPNGTVDQPTPPNDPTVDIRTSDSIAHPVVTVRINRNGSVTVQ